MNKQVNLHFSRSQIKVVRGFMPVWDTTGPCVIVPLTAFIAYIKKNERKKSFLYISIELKIAVLVLVLGKPLILWHLRRSVFPCIYNTWALKSRSNRFSRRVGKPYKQVPAAGLPRGRDFWRAKLNAPVTGAV